MLRVDAELDKTTGIATWRFTSLDPATMETLPDPDEGFLPPNTNPPAGDGQVHFTILPKAALAGGTELRNQARVFFDTNAPIDTPQWLNTVDAGSPTTCGGDCNEDVRVTVDELVRGINIALGLRPPAACSSFDANRDGQVTVDEIVLV